MTGLVQAQFSADREPAGPSSRKTGLVITEIFYNPRLQPEDPSQSLEFIEIYNAHPWEKDIGGYSVTGDVAYVFPPAMVMAPESYLVLARAPDLIQSVYGITNVVGPWEGWETNRLSTERGLVQLRNRQGAVLLDVDYRDSPPWPEGADGTGHSLVLARPSYGEADPRAWSQSDSPGGSPGGEDPLSDDPATSVLINEWQNHSDPVDWVELYNHSNQPVDLSGAMLSDDPAGTNQFRLPDGTIIPPRGFLSYDQNQMGFELFAGGETIFFWSSNMTRLVDVIDFRGQSNNVSTGRSPDGGPFFYTMATRTQGGPNRPPLEYAIGINEIMYNPPSGNTDEEYVEIHNHSALPVNLAGWGFVVGIDFIFPTNTLTMSMPPGAYWVIASNPEVLMSLHPHLTTNNTFGPYQGTLANGGERLVFAAADYDIVGGTVERLPIPISDLTYDDGGHWGYWSDGDGSSLELIDPRADVGLPSNWADSLDRTNSLWTAIEMDVPLGESLGDPVNDRLILMLQGSGECLLDEIEVRADQGPNLVVNGGFESGLDGWSLQGSHDFSTLEDEGFAGGKSLHVRAGSRGENQSNRILSAPFTAPIPPGTRMVSIRAKARWLHGFPGLLMRLHGSATEAFGQMAIPARLGTPGGPNSRFMGNAGPAVYDVAHWPPLPDADEPLRVTARASDYQGILSVTLRYRIDPDPVNQSQPMMDNGTSGDEVAGDGIYTALLPAQAAGTMAAFHVEARDGANVPGTFPHFLLPEPGLDRTWPVDAMARECVVRWGEVQMPGQLATYHLWVTSVNSNRWHVRDPMNNTEVDGTFVYNNTRVIYNTLPLYSGSPWHRTNSTTGPAGPNRVDYEMNFPDGDLLLGANDFVLNNSGNPDILTISDFSAVAEQTVYEIFDAMDQPYNNRRYIHFFVNGSQRSTAYERPGNFIFEDSQQPNGDMIEQWFPEDAGGQLFKVEDWFEFEPNGFDFHYFDDADLSRRTVMVDGVPTFQPGPYRYKFRKRSIGTGNSANEFGPVYELIDAVSPADDPDSATVDPERLAQVVNWEDWMRHFAIQRAVGNFDSYGWERGKNDYLYQTTNGFVHVPWDIDYSLGLGRPADAPLFASNDPRIVAMFNTPAITRAYWRAFKELVNGPYQNSHLDPLIDKRVDVLLANNINIDLDAVAGIKAYINDRRNFLLAQLDTVQAPFTVNLDADIVSSNNLVILTGTAPVEVKDILLNGQPYPVTWTSATEFTLRLVIPPGLAQMTLDGVDRLGNPVPDAMVDFFTDYTGPVVVPSDALRLTEVFYASDMPGTQFIEFVNDSPVAFDLGGWRMDGVDMVFPAGTIVANHETFLLVADRSTFEATFGRRPIKGVFGGGLSPGGEVLALLLPDDSVANGIRYEIEAPWPDAEIGQSLQVIDLGRDNRRASNWAVDVPSPGESNAVAADLPDYDPVWINEVQSDNLAGILDNQGEAEPWLEFYNAGAAPVSLDGYYLATDYVSNLTEWPLPAGLTLGAGAYLVVWGDGQPEQTEVGHLHTPFRLDYAGRVALVRLVNSEPEITDYLTWPSLSANTAYGDFPDGQPVYRETLHQPTPGLPNERQPLAVFVNEWMARNDLAARDPIDLDYEDWFELFNGESFPADLRGFFLTDELAQPTKFEIPDAGQSVIPPRGHLLVWADDESHQNDQDDEALHANFKLAGDAGVIALFAPDGLTLVTLITYGNQVSDISQGRFSDGAGAIYDMPSFTPGSRNLVPGINNPPIFPPLPEVFLFPGQRMTVTARAEDPDVPLQTVNYTFEPMLEGAAMNAAGLFRWIVPTNQAPGDYVFTIHAMDNGIPPRGDTATQTWHILDPNGNVSPLGPEIPIIRTFYAADGQVTLTFLATPGLTYRVLYKDDLNPPAWTRLDRDFVAGNVMASVTDPMGTPHRFYQVEVIVEGEAP